MQPHWLSIAGLSFDIIGAFFLAAEAIKIRNVVTLRVRYLERAYDATKSPEIVWTSDGHGYVQASRAFLVFFTALHYFAGACVLFVANALLKGALVEWLFWSVHWLSAKPWYWVLLGGILAVVWGGVFGVWSLGELVHVALTKTLRAAVWILEFIERRTADGVVGVIGFFTILIGFLLQIAGTVLAAP